MTDDKTLVARLRALLAKASLGPWELAGNDPAHIVVLDEETGSIVGHIAEAGRDDAELIAALCNAAQDLLDAAERARDARNAALEEAAKVADRKSRNGRAGEYDDGMVDGAESIATAIRALKEPK